MYWSQGHVGRPKEVPKGSENWSCEEVGFMPRAQMFLELQHIARVLEMSVVRMRPPDFGHFCGA